MKVFSILKKDLLILLRNRAEMLVLFLMPLAFILPISFALGAGDGYGIQSRNRGISLPVVNYDNGPHAQALLTAIGESLRLEPNQDASLVRSLGLTRDPDCQADKPAATPTSAVATPAQTAAPGGTVEAVKTPEAVPLRAACLEKISRRLVQDSSRTAVLIIPAGFSDAIAHNRPVSVTLVYDPAGDSVRLQQIEGVVHGAAIKISLQNQVGNGLSQMNDLVTFAPDSVRLALQSETHPGQTAGTTPAIRIETTEPGRFQLARTPDTYQQTIPGYTVMYVFFIISSLASSIRQERLNGTFRRLLSAPVSKAELLTGKLLATLLVGTAQATILFMVGILVFKMKLGRDPLAFFLLTLALAGAATTLGMAAATTRLGGGGLAAPLIIAALLGGCMFPLDLMPPFLRNLSYAVPHSWALTGYQNLMVRKMGLAEVLPQIAALLGFSGLFFLIALRRFKFDEQGNGQ